MTVSAMKNRPTSGQSSSSMMKTGFTSTGEKFPVPPTPDMFYTLINPALWGPAELLVVGSMLLNLILFAIKAPLSFYIFIFVFWRASYNAGLGVLLHYQSHSTAYTRWIQGLSNQGRGLVRWAVSKSLGPGYEWMETPVEFNSWIAFRALAMLVLSNDGWTYALLALRCWQPLVLNTYLDYIGNGLCFLTGIVLLLICGVVKANAHDCVGDYAWYWGDFFFKIDGNFSFNGVFRFFPHPMYTVGYSAYYGLSLIARSYTLLAISLLAHLAQIAFLIAVEEPHMQKIYGNPTKTSEKQTKADALSACDGGTERDKSHNASMNQEEVSETIVIEQRPERWQKEMVGFSNFNIFRSSDFVLAAMVLTTVGTSLFAPVGRKFHLLQLAFWWSVHWLGLGVILKMQSRNRFWTRRFEQHGMSSEEAYAHWKIIFNFSVVMNRAAFALAVINLGQNPYTSWSAFFSAKSLAYFGIGISLILMSIYCSISVFAALGSYGYFYGDFYTMNGKPPTPIYSHIYRYTNNPELLFGHLSHYGIALISKSKPILATSLCLHLLHLIFVYSVEFPHFRRVHKEHREAPALQESISNVLEEIGKEVPILRQCYFTVVLTIRTLWIGICNFVIKSATKGAQASRRLLEEVRKHIMSEKSKVKERIVRSKPYRHVVMIGKDAKERVRRFDGKEIVNLLERRGVKIEGVETGKIFDSQNAHGEDEKNEGSSGDGIIESIREKSKAEGIRRRQKGLDSSPENNLRKLHGIRAVS